MVTGLIYLILTTDARWYTREEVIAVLEHAQGTNFTRRDYKNMARIQDGATDESKPTAVTGSGTGSDPLAGDATVTANQTKATLKPPLPSQTSDEPAFRVPPLTAIAGVLISHWAYQQTPPPPAPMPVKGNL